MLESDAVAWPFANAAGFQDAQWPVGKLDHARRKQEFNDRDVWQSVAAEDATQTEQKAIGDAGQRKIVLALQGTRMAESWLTHIAGVSYQRVAIIHFDSFKKQRCMIIK